MIYQVGESIAVCKFWGALCIIAFLEKYRYSEYLFLAAPIFGGLVCFGTGIAAYVHGNVNLTPTLFVYGFTDFFGAFVLIQEARSLAM
jgi:hypothetical protein